MTLATIAITGHRILPNPSGVAESIRKVFHSSIFCDPALLSPLAEGADRLAALEILRLPNSTLHAILPFDPDEYQSDFQSPESRAKFQSLLSQATSTLVMPAESSRPQAYLAVGRHLVEQCDVLIAVWDRSPARGNGGTAQIVAYARKLEKPLIIIDSLDPNRITWERLSGQGESFGPQ